MFAKGDRIKDQYANFDFSRLDKTQLSILNKLSFFAKHKERIAQKFNGTHISRDVKIIFLDTHSMKLGNAIFYDLESKRQDYL
jgi:hypothetical protein